MNTRSPILVGVIVAMAPWSLVGDTAYSQTSLPATWAAIESIGQNGTRAADPKREVASLLARARKAISEGDWNAADRLISQAEAQHVQFGKLHFGDTPDKLRRELERLRPVEKSAGGQVPDRATGASQIPPANQVMPPQKSKAMSQPPSRQTAADQRTNRVGREAPSARTVERVAARGDQTFPPAGDGAGPAARARASTPFDAVDQGAAQAQTVTRLPAVTEEAVMPQVEPLPAEPKNSQQPAAGLAAQAPPRGDDNRAQSDRLLLAARKSLAVGDATQAARLAAQAKTLAVRYDLHDDSPAKVEGTIQKYSELARLSGNKESEAYRRRYVDLLMSQAEQLLVWKEYEDAERLATDAARIPVTYGPFDAKPDDLLNRLGAARRRSGRFRDNEVAPVGFDTPVAPEGTATAPANAVAQQAPPRQGPEAARGVQPAAQGKAGTNQRAFYDANRDPTRNIPVTGKADAGPPMNPKEDLFRIPDLAAPAPATTRVSGESPAENVDAAQPAVPQRIEPVVPAQRPAPAAASAGSLLTKTAADEQVLARKVIADLAAQRSEAKRLQATDPKKSLEILRQARESIEKSGLDTETRDRLLRSADRGISDAEQYIETNRPRIELDERNQSVKDEIDREQKVKVEVQEKLAYYVDDFNKLMDEQRWPEAEVVAKRAQELSPEEPVVQQLLYQVRFVRRLANSKQIQSDKENGFVEAMNSVDAAATAFDDRNPIQFASVEKWESLSKSKFRQKVEGRSRRSEKEIEIEKSLKTPVSLKFQDAPLSEVMDHLKTLAGVNIYTDPQGLAAEGITTDTPVSIDLTSPISLKSALNLILGPLHLSYVIKDEVLKVTSEQLRDSEVITVTYNVADLVVPIPNFAPDGNMGLTGALNSAQASARAGMGGGLYSSDAPLAVASANGANTNAVMDPRILAQIGGSGGPMSGMNSLSNGPGGLSGGAQPDFDSLIDLIVQTIQPDSWDANGGPGSVTRFQNNLSLVISQKQDVHEEIADLLSQLRRLQDLQVTIEVRFITLNDNFFERIGIDFQMSLQDFAPGSLIGSGNVGTLGQGSALASYDPQLTRKNSATVGTSAAGLNQFTDDLNIDLTQGSFAAAVPQFGTYAAGSGATLGFAILSDIEAYFFLEASQGDRRSNVLQAPKVTLFNGQQAFVSDTSQSPFVISVIPVVGDFAAAQQPVIVVLSEGTMLTVQAVVSADRRFVRLTLVPFFSSIGAVNTFKFTGSSSSTTNSASFGPTDSTTGRANTSSNTTEGTTVQLPTFAFVSVSTTVSVPDGGTVLLGGVKRLSEGRNEFGVPILNKIPYVNRLFQNVGIGRQSESLMMMVTPRIIIQEEEEFNLTGQTPPVP